MKKIVIPVILFILRFAAKMQLAKYNPQIIGVAGSSGKTSLVRLIGNILSKKFRVLQTSGQNSEIGLPLHILGLDIGENSILDWLRILFLLPFQLLLNWKRYDIFVAEMGIDSPVEPKNMSYLLKIIKPTVAVVTNVSLEHSVYFEPYIDEINPDIRAEKILSLTAEQETMPLTALSADGIAVVNLDDARIQDAADGIVAKKITISLTQPADLVAKDIVSDLSSFSMTIVANSQEYNLHINQPLPKHFAYEFLLTLGVVNAMKIPLDEAINLLTQTFALPAGRLSFFKGINNSILIDSTYNNATLPPILDILDFIQNIAGNRRKIAIIGDMRELGEEAEDIHKEVAKKLLQTVDFAILIGPLSEKYIAPVLEKAKFSYEDFPDVTSSKKAILNLIQEGDVVLVKGSQNTLFLERIVEMLLENKKDAEKLARRGAFWDKKRSESL